MSFKFGPSSMERRETLHPHLRLVLDKAIESAEEDFSIICGYRGVAEQTKAYNAGKSMAKFGQSKHNFYPSMAVDLAPYPIDWEDAAAFERLANHIFEVAGELGIKIRWGGNFKNLVDRPHFELIV